MTGKQSEHLRGVGLRAAAERFRGFFQELGRAFVEREDLLAQIALALLSREHVLMTGPPGTAKSGVAAAVLGRIVDERTGKPSVFARQFTESTVQTDLVGPIDFKTLMATGRTEHFTDEGMLGAVHAFLDEVLDGRDMLLRTTLNVLHERELKQGTKTTEGQIECALMTTNRYLAEVLEGSRETLLAFVDRIAFVSFVPKGFADPASLGKVLRSNVGGLRAQPKALLTIQDLDLLQAAADEAVVPDEICDALCALCAQLDTDLAAAAKHDPTFVPSRYLSTRTTVRLARILRAVSVFDAVMNDTLDARPLEVQHADLAMLRLSLLLSGPDKEGTVKLLEKESDPRERRQLSILRTEREIFDRALGRLPKPASRGAAKKNVHVAELARAVEEAVPQPATAPLLDAATKLAQVTDAGGPGSLQAADLLDTTLAHLTERALRIGTTAGAGIADGDVVGELVTLADGLERASGTARPVARWLRGRAIRILLDTAALSSSKVGAALADGGMSRATSMLEELEALLTRVAQLRSAGADEPAADELDRATQIALARVEAELAEAWDDQFRESVAKVLPSVGRGDLGLLLAALSPALEDVDAVGARLAKLGAKAGGLKALVLAPRIEPLVAAAFDRIETTDRVRLVEEVGVLVDRLGQSDLRGVLAKSTVLRLAIGALARTERAAAPAPVTADFEGYRRLRANEERVSLAFTTVELAAFVHAEGKPVDDIRGAMASFVGALPDALRKRVAELDLARVRRAVDLLESWWKTIAPAGGEAADDALARLADSRFFHVTRDEGALLRFALETRVLGEVFPDASEPAAALRLRIDALEAESSRAVAALRRGRADAAWDAVLAVRPRA